MEKVLIGIIILGSFFMAVTEQKKSTQKVAWDTLQVTASAYNALSAQTTKSNPAITAFGDTLREGMKVIAVSRDLLLTGLSYNTKVRIEGFEGIYRVKDKMNKRWKNKIDIYMGQDVQKALNWGVRPVTIYYSSSD